MLDLKFKVLPDSSCKMTDDTVTCTVSVSMNMFIMDDNILSVTFSNNKLEASLFSMNGAIKGDVDIQLGTAGATYVNEMGLTKADF